MQAYRASILHLLDDPTKNAEAVAFHEDGLLLVEDGQVAGCGAYAELSPWLGDAEVHDLTGHLITPGFIDTHIHLPQVDERHLGELLMHFMLETIVAAHLLGVDPFDQPAVEEGKVLAKKYLAG